MAIKPVELEILLKGSESLKSAKEGTDALTRSMKAYMSQMGEANSSAEAMESVMKGVREVLGDVGSACEANEREMSRLRAEFTRLNAQLESNVSAGSKEEAGIRSRIQQIRGELTVRKSLENALRSGSSELQRASESLTKEGGSAEAATAAHETLRQKIRALKEEMADMRLNGIDEQSEAYKRLAAELGRLQDVQGDISRQGSVLSNDQSRFAGIVSGLRGVTAAFTAAQGAMALFGTENEKLQETMAKLQSLMYITISLQQVSEVLNKDSAFSLVTLTGLRQWWNKLLAVGRGETVASTAAETAETAAITSQTAAVTGNTAAKTGNSAAQTAQTASAVAGTAANIGLAGAFRMVGAAIKSIPVFGWIAAAIGAIITAVELFSSKAKAAKEAAEAFYKAVSEEVYQPIGALEELSSAWRQLGDDMEAKTEFVESNREAFEKLGVSIESVSDAENLLVTNADAFINAQIAKAKATVLLQQAMEKTKDLVKLEQEIDDLNESIDKQERNAWDNFFGRSQYDVDHSKAVRRDKLIAQAEELRAEIEPIYAKVRDYEQEAADLISNADIKETEPKSDATKAVAEKMRSSSMAELRESVKTLRRLRDLEAQIERENTQGVIDAMDDGREKKLAKIEDEYEQRKAEIAKQAKELAELNKEAGITGLDAETGLTANQTADIKSPQLRKRSV